MLSKQKADVIADTLNVECRKQVLHFVMAHADLPPDEFDAVTETYLSAVERKMRDRLGNDFDDLDALMMEGYRRAMLFEYKRLRTAGASTAGNA